MPYNSIMSDHPKSSKLFFFGFVGTLAASLAYWGWALVLQKHSSPYVVPVVQLVTVTMMGLALKAHLTKPRLVLFSFAALLLALHGALPFVLDPYDEYDGPLPGTPFPEFSLVQSNGRVFGLEELKAVGPSVVVFYRGW